jgi:hypothetical protein
MESVCPSLDLTDIAAALQAQSGPAATAVVTLEVEPAALTLSRNAAI